MSSGPEMRRMPSLEKSLHDLVSQSELTGVASRISEELARILEKKAAQDSAQQEASEGE